ncbi:MAG TPA: T3SS effector HopA1 family protein [Prolixibacteraceae bacterium]|nr:T3SS effector HopA1 family protein [Prolixibacteraceae bacterium]
MNDINADILKVANSVNIISKTEYSLKGMVRNIAKIKIIDPYGNLSTDKNSKDTNTEIFYNVLASDIYNMLYVASESSSQINQHPSDDFLINLSLANSGIGTWDEGWTMIGRDKYSDKIIVKKNDTKFWTCEKDVITENQNFSEGAHCIVKVGKEVQKLNSHFYMAFGNTWKKDIPDYENRMLRFYWNLTPEGAIHYIKLITECLNQRNIFFRTKVISSPDDYCRADAGVLYIDGSQLEDVIPCVLDTHKKICGYLKTNVPLFSKFIAKGLGFAEDPGNGNSFGISRSKLLAHALYDNFLNKNAQEEVLSTIDHYFNIEGIDSRYPYASRIKLNDYENLFKDLPN